MKRKYLFVGLIFICLFLANITNAQSTYFADDFENGVSTEWDSVKGRVIADPTGSGQGFIFSGEDIEGNGYIQSLIERRGFEFITNVTVIMKWYDDGIDADDELFAHIEPQDGSGNIGFMAINTSNFWFYYEDPISPGQIEFETDIPRTVGWHEFKFIVSADGTSAFLDNQFVDTIDFITVLENIVIQGEGGGAVYWDDVSVQSNMILGHEIHATGDSFLRQGMEDRNEGANQILRVQGSGHNRAVVGFDANAIESFGLVTKATLRLAIESAGTNWGSTGRVVNAHPLNINFGEGNGKALGVPTPESTRGTGSGVTWRCAIDTDISNQQGDCEQMWNGGDFANATASGVIHTNGMTGFVEWDVTSELLQGATSWLLKKDSEGQSGTVNYYSKEGATNYGNVDLAPTLILE